MARLVVTYEDLMAAAGAVGAAARELDQATTLGETARKKGAQVWYQPAAAKAEAVGSKAGTNLNHAYVVLSALKKGLEAAAEGYKKTDQGVGG